MKFNWLVTGETNPSIKRICIDLEYRLRPKITKFLLSKLDSDSCGDFSCFHFDVDIESQQVRISEKTPKNFIEKIRSDFDREINGSLPFQII